MVNLTDIGKFGYKLIGDYSTDCGEKGFNSPRYENTWSYLFFLTAFVYPFRKDDVHEQVTVLPRDLETTIKGLDPYSRMPDWRSEVEETFTTSDKIEKKVWGFRHTAYEKRFLKTSDLLEHYIKDEPLWIAQWGIPNYKGCEERWGHLFGLTIYTGESQAQQVREAILQNPGIVRETGELFFPEKFNGVTRFKKDKTPIKDFPHHLVDVHYEMTQSGLFIPKYAIKQV